MARKNIIKINELDINLATLTTEDLHELKYLIDSDIEKRKQKNISIKQNFLFRVKLALENLIKEFALVNNIELVFHGVEGYSYHDNEFLCKFAIGPVDYIIKACISVNYSDYSELETMNPLNDLKFYYHDCSAARLLNIDSYTFKTHDYSKITLSNVLNHIHSILAKFEYRVKDMSKVFDYIGQHIGEFKNV